MENIVHYWEYFVGIPMELGALINRAVEEFAKKNSLNADLWIQDLPLWSVWYKDDKASVIRRLQVGAYRVGRGEELRIVPQVFALDKEQNTLTAFEQIDPKDILAKRIGDLEEDRDVLSLLEKAWKGVLKMPRPEQSEGISIPVSPHHRW